MLLLNVLRLVSVFCIVVAFVNFLWRRRRLYYLAAKLPGPRGLPLIGMGHKFIAANYKGLFHSFATTTDGYKSPAAFWLGPELLVYVETPESIQKVLNSTKCFEKSLLYKALLCENGLAFTNLSRWKVHRKILNPSFSMSVLKGLVPTFHEKTQILIKQMEVELEKKPFDVYNYMLACSLESLLKTTMNTDRDILSNASEDELIHNLEKSLPVLMKKMSNMLYYIEPIYKMTNVYKLEQKYYQEGVLSTADEVMKVQNKLNIENSNQMSDEHLKMPKNFIETLMSAKDILSSEEIRDEINLFMVAGHDTSALVLSNALLMIAMHSDVQEKVVQELKEVFSKSDSHLEYNDLHRLVYTEMVIKETMRLFPVLPFAGRTVSEEFEIDGYTIPVGASIILPTFKVQRNPKYWGNDSHQFRPERFEPESFKKIHPYAYIPFMAGPRNCIGSRYAMMFMKILLANFLRMYEVKSPLMYKELEFELLIAMRICQKNLISLKKRNFDK